MAKKYSVIFMGDAMELTLTEMAEGMGVDKVTLKSIREGAYPDLTLSDSGTSEPTEDVVTYPDSFADQKSLKKYIKKQSDQYLIDWGNSLELTWKDSDHKAILRMRVAMAINEKFYPKEKKVSKKSKYAEYTTEQLVQMAVDNNVEYKPTEDTRILRMRAIMALREAGYIA